MKIASKFKGRLCLISLAAWAGVLGPADMAWAHRLSQGDSLPAPLWLYALSVMATLMAAVAIIDAFVQGEGLRPLRGGLLGHGPMVHLLVPPIAIGGAVVGVFIVLLSVSAVDDPSPEIKAWSASALEQTRAVRITMPPGITFEHCLTLTPDDTLSYWFQADQPLVFDIHYHTQNVRYDAIDAHSVRHEQRTYTPFLTQEYCLTWQNPVSSPIGLSWAFAVTTSGDKARLIP
ncbi:MAG: hypothetical protein ETSY1_10735 [Candidatus Entotheonella factor]|uniref:Uncharacterized protein n=1 Tax=Entotheonella factor TaxID=1429438 RepID=W4LRH8_ENTF1|nr:hypothetical protein [Candidatus Entotheonella palauensis]ETX00593.1 MAG: hypothetical protein ETSY1_10735 [Candidatus Entotheonella factor]